MLKGGGGGGSQARLSQHMSKYHNVEFHMPRLILFYFVQSLVAMHSKIKNEQKSTVAQFVEC